MATKKSLRIGFDLDGVIINKPPFVPKKVIELLVRSHSKKGLTYRYPSSAFERWIRWLSHHPLLRPPIEKNLKLVKKLSENSNYQLFAISSRYSFLELRTKKWFDKHEIKDLFEGVYLNLTNEQPHIFKEYTIDKLKLDIFIDDDDSLVKYLKKRLKKIKLINLSDKRQDLEKFIMQ
jgi:uncharacterized HAD superfamily protein